MNIMNKLTIRQLKLNKKRTIVTIVGAIISVAMITAVATLGISFMDLMQRQAIENDGEWHVVYESVNKSQLQAIKDDQETKKVSISRDVGYALLEKSQNHNKPYVFIKEYNEEGFKNFPIELSQGRFPESKDEIVISEAIGTNGKVNYKIGDVITFDIGQRYSESIEDEKEALVQNTPLQKDNNTISEVLTKEETRMYTIVGMINRPVWEPTWSPGYTVLSYVDENTIASNERVNAFVVLNKVDSTLFINAQDTADENDIQKISFNNSLLRYYGVVEDNSIRNMLFTLSSIIMIIIMVGSISLIYNAFAISVSERSRYLGMLSSVGATKRQKRNSVFFEGVIIGAVSIPIGIIAGIIGIWVTFLCINPTLTRALNVSESLTVVISPMSLFIAVILSAVTILVSTYIPAKRASNLSTIDAIRQTTDVKMKRKQVKTSKLTRKIFGIEGDIGLKNLKRNKARYKATLFSLIISMVLFLVVSSFTDDLKKSLLLSQDGINFDIQAEIKGETEGEKEDIIKSIISLDNITDSVETESFDAITLVQKSAIADYLKGHGEDILQNDKYPYYISIYVLNDAALESYAKVVGVNYELLLDKNTPSAIVIDTVKYKDMQEDKYVETKAIKTRIGEKLDLSYYNVENEKEEPVGYLRIVALTNQMPMGVMSQGQTASFNVILSKEVFNEITQTNADIIQSVNSRLFLKSNNPLRLQEDMEAIQKLVGEGKINIYNVFMGRQREEQMLLLISVFTYAFILLITFICVANIFNTISTSIALRKREFAMLKSVGMTPKSFNKMVNYESIFYGLKALIYGLPISVVLMYMIHRTLMAEFTFKFTIPVLSVVIAIIAVFLIVGVTMLYSINKIKKENIIDSLKQESI